MNTTARISDATRDVLEEALIRYLNETEQERADCTTPAMTDFYETECDLIRTAFTEIGIDPEHITR